MGLTKLVRYDILICSTIIIRVIYILLGLRHLGVTLIAPNCFRKHNMHKTIFELALAGEIELIRRLRKFPDAVSVSLRETLIYPNGPYINNPYDVVEFYCKEIYGADDGTVDYIADLCYEKANTGMDAGRAAKKIFGILLKEELSVATFLQNDKGDYLSLSDARNE